LFGDKFRKKGLEEKKKASEGFFLVLKTRMFNNKNYCYCYSCLLVWWLLPLFAQAGTLFVSSTMDSGSGSLREAAMLAPPGVTIRFCKLLLVVRLDVGWNTSFSNSRIYYYLK